VRTLAAPIPSQESVCRLRHGVKRKPGDFVVAEQVKEWVLSVPSRGELRFKLKRIEVLSSIAIDVPFSMRNAPQIDISPRHYSSLAAQEFIGKAIILSCRLTGEQLVDDHQVRRTDCKMRG
jgi:hypothetical protein